MNKWMPFNSVISGNKLIDSIILEKNKIVMPTLSEDQLADIENKLLNAFHNQEKVKIKYYNKGNLYIKEGLINEININSKKILFNKTNIFFSQIIEIK